MNKKQISLLMVVMLFLGISAMWAKTPTHECYIAKGTPNLATKYASWTPGGAYPDASVAGDENFFISRVKFKKRFTNVNTQVLDDSKKEMRSKRRVMWWVPIGGDGWTSLPNYEFNYDAFSSWNYIDNYGNWTEGAFRCPGAFSDVCHKNGVTNSVVTQPGWQANLTTDGNGAIMAAVVKGGADKLLKLFRYYGIDGWGFNSECSFAVNVNGVNLTTGLQNFFAQCHAQKAAYGVDQLHFDWYDGVLNGGGQGFSEMLGDGNVNWFHNGTNYVCNGFFTNYNGTTAGMQNSVATAGGKGADSYNVHFGMDMQGRSAANWSGIDANAVSIGIWGAHNTNMVYLGIGEDGADPATSQAVYLRRQEYVFTGGTRNPVNTPAISSLLTNGNKTNGPDFHGISKLVAAKSSLSWIQNGYFPFVTYFNMGNGQKLYREGQSTFPNGWYNIGMQDYLPTWRWWITTSFMGKTPASEGVSATFTWDDAWNGGSCLKVKTTAISSFFLHLFKTQFPLASGETYNLKIRYKVTSGTAKGFAWALSNEGSETTAGNNVIAQNLTASNQWVEKDVNLNGILGKTLALMALRFVNTSADFEILIGEVSLMKEGVTYTPSTPVIANSSNLKSYYNGVDFKLIWNCAAKGATIPEGGGETTPEAETAVRAATMNCTYTGNMTNTPGRKLSSLTLTGNNGSSTASGTIQSANTSPVYTDKRTVSLAAKRGETMTLTPTYTGSWMHGYVYVDWNNDGTFNTTDELVSYSYLEGNNSLGATSVSDAIGVTPPSFTIPATVALGTYTLRYKIDWNDSNPCGRTGANSTSANGGSITDFELHVTAPAAGGTTPVAGDYQSIYNEDIDVSCFNVYIQEQGKDAILCTQTTSWAAYVVGAPVNVTPGTTSVRFGVSSVSLDGKTESEIQWTNYSTITQTELSVLNDVVIDKPVIKANEEFTIKYADPNHSTSNWIIRNSTTGETVATGNSVVSLTLTLTNEGSYDVLIDGNLTPGLIQISPASTGAMPQIKTITKDKARIKEDNEETATVSYTSRDADGTVSKGLKIEDPNAFVARVADLTSSSTITNTEFAKKAPWTYALWFKATNINHAEQGTNLIYKTDINCDWPQNNWGEFWVQIRPQGVTKNTDGGGSCFSGTCPTKCVANEISLNVTGWSAHDNARWGSTAEGYPLVPGTWYHLAVSLQMNSGSTTTGTECIYINGKLVSRSTNTMIYDSGCQSGSNCNSAAFQRDRVRLYVGAPGVYKAGFAGVIDEVQCWDKVLSATEVAQCMKGYAKGAAPTNLKGYWTFDETETKIVDGKSVETFPNWGKGTSAAFGYYSNPTIKTTDADGGTLVEAFNGDNPEAGCPMIPGQYVVETTPTWTWTGGSGTLAGSTYNRTSGSVKASNADVVNPFKVFLTLKNSWGTSTTESVDIDVYDWTVGLDEKQLVDKMEVYPNPFVEFVSMRFPKGGYYTFDVMDLQGRCISSRSNQTEAGEIVHMQVEGEAGTYMIRIRNEKNVVIETLKVVKK